MKSDIIVIGAGAAGMMAAIGAAEEFARQGLGSTVTILEKMPKPGRKIMVSGKGRCNFTNVKEWDEFSAHIRSESAFVSPAFHNLTPEGVVKMFKANGLPSVIERGDRAFPASGYAGDVVDMLQRTCTLAGVKTVTGCRVKDITTNGKLFKLTCEQTTIKENRLQGRKETLISEENHTCSKLIIATGGLSYPWTGSTGDGYRWAEGFGHTIETCLPSLTALVPDGYKDIHAASAQKSHPLPENYPSLEGHIERITPLSRLGEALNGNSLDNVQLTLYVNGVEAQSEFGDIEFTDGGLEGPVGYQISRKAVKALNSGSKVKVVIDLKPAVEEDRLNEDIHNKWKEITTDPRSKGAPFRKLFRIMLGKLMPWDATLGFLQCNPDVSVDTLAHYLKNWEMDIAGFVGYERAVITAGGVSCREIVAKTLESKKLPGLYFAGELLDTDSDTGGYNLQTAFCTGYLAGISAAKSLG